MCEGSGEKKSGRKLVEAGKKMMASSVVGVTQMSKESPKIASCMRKFWV